MRVQVYFNLHKKIYSIRCKKTRLVIGHSRTVSLENVEFKVSKKGRDRVLRERRKNVHAVIEGDLLQEYESLSKGMIGVMYNPYRFESFVTTGENIPVYDAKKAFLWVTNKKRTKVVMK